MHGGFCVGDEQTTAAVPGGAGQDMAGRVLVLKAEQARQQREWDEDIAEHIAHDAQFMTVGEFGQEIVRRHHVTHHEAWSLAYQVLRSHPELELFCRWRESFRWSPLPPCPVAPASRARDKNQRYYNGKFGPMGPTYMHPVCDGSRPSPDPLGSALGQCDHTGWWPTDCLAIRRDLAERLLGCPVAADDRETQSTTQALDLAPDVVQFDPLTEAEQPSAPVWKVGRNWTAAAKDKMRQQRSDGWDDGRIAKHWGFKRQNVARLIGSQMANKAKANTPQR